MENASTQKITKGVNKITVSANSTVTTTDITKTNTSATDTASTYVLSLSQQSVVKLTLEKKCKTSNINICMYSVHSYEHFWRIHSELQCCKVTLLLYQWNGIVATYTYVACHSIEMIL